jgi:hypothetical protein
MIMGGAISAIFGGKPKKPKQIVQQQRQIEKVQQDVKETSKESILNLLAKRRRATILSQLTDARIAKRKLGAG